MRFTFFLLCLLGFLNAQETKLNLKKPGPKDFAYNKCDFDENANAIIINEEARLEVMHEIANIYIKRRIKILNDQGKDEAIIKIPYYYGRSGTENISNIKAYTINGTSENPIVIEVDKDDVHEVDLNEYWKEIRFTFPSVEAGSILDYSYRFETKNLWFIESWEFQHELPTERSYFSITNRTGMNYNMLLQGDKLMDFANKKVTLKKITLNDIPSFNELEHVYNYKDHIEKISFQNEQSSKTWRGLVKHKITDLRSNRRMAVIRDIAEVIPKHSNEKEMLKNIATYMKENFAWNGFHGQWPMKNINQIIKNKEGNSAGINYLFHLLVNEMDMKSDLMMVSSRPNGKMTAVFPYLGQFDQLINLITFRDNSKWIIDASNMNLDQLRFYPLKLSNHYGLILNENASFVEVKTPFSEFNFQDNYSLEDGTYKKISNSKWNGYFNIESAKKTSTLQPLNIFNINFDYTEEPTKEFRNDFYFSKSVSFGEKPTDKILTLENPLFNFIEYFVLKKPTRNTMVEYDFPFYVKGNVILQIPKNYKAEIPENLSINLDDHVVYSQVFTQRQGKILMNYSFLMNKTIYQPKEYKTLKEFVDKVFNAAQIKVILKKET